MLRNIFVLGFLSLFVNLASAEETGSWVFVGESTDTRVFIHPSNFRVVRGGGIRVWFLSNHKVTDGPVGSNISQEEVSCVSGSSRILQINLYSGASGEGKILRSTNSPGDWIEPPPGSLGEAMIKMACVLLSKTIKKP